MINWSRWAVRSARMAKPKRKKKRAKSKPSNPDPYRHILVEDKIDWTVQRRTITVSCPLEYPGLTPPERRRMYEGLGMVAEVFRVADIRCKKVHDRKA